MDQAGRLIRSGCRTIQTNASPVIAPATNPVTPTMMAVLARGSSGEPPENIKMASWLR
jgi:hypothetical protein